jgi:hypothetical protein
MAKHAASTRLGIRRILGLVVAVLVVATAFVVVSRMNSATADRSAPDAPSTSSRAAESRSTGSPDGSASLLPATSLQATLTGPAVAALPATGPGVTEPGILLIASPAADGSFDVLEQVRLSGPVSVLTLRPAPVQRAGQQFASASAAATRIEVSAGDQPVVVPGGTVGSPVDLPVADADRFELRYRLGDVTVRSTPSTDGRALAAIGPLTGGVGDDFPVLVIVPGGTVLGLSCPLLPLSQQACGSRVQSEQALQRELPWSLALTSVQFNVPPA